MASFKIVQKKLKNPLTSTCRSERVSPHTVTTITIMRTKALFAAAAILAAGFASSMAQSNVYSLNVVGYVNVVLKGGGKYNMIANPLKNSNNSITNLFKGANMAGQDGSLVFTWNANATDFGAVIPQYSTDLNGWTDNINLAPGQGFYYVNAGGSDITNTFVGEVIQGSYTNPIVGSGAYNLIGSSAPIGGSFTNSIGGLPGNDGDVVFTWDANATDFGGVIPQYSTDLNGWDNNVNVGVGEALFYVRAGSGVQWVRNFTVQ